MDTSESWQVDGFENSIIHPQGEGNEGRLKKVTAILPYVRDRVLLQLRDIKRHINFPGTWGFFGGSVEGGESIKRGAYRELFEEIGYKPEVLFELSTDIYNDTFLIHSFFCPLTVSVEKITLNEGLDFALASLQKVLSGKIYSDKLKRFFPMADSEFIARIMRRMFNNIDSG